MRYEDRRTSRKGAGRRQIGARTVTGQGLRSRPWGNYKSSQPASPFSRQHWSARLLQPVQEHRRPHSVNFARQRAPLRQFTTRSPLLANGYPID